jgi:hypothetical protein
MKMKIKISYQSQFFAAGCCVIAGIGLMASSWSEASAIIKENDSVRLFIFGGVLLFSAVTQAGHGADLYRKSKVDKAPPEH